ncbi:Chaperone protein ClpD, chloroplastic [Apostasia shenzhenica]|uniref:Chaperone protein ClpD, chloroplastic n=1 Tax=Apostasia shenzhenica TaxID=1088818 RepID=A0A2I0ATQ9_9ASPA|nr:Chaperone protein ClpD, chloroplastic [Apostasia shenzhenica]
MEATCSPSSVLTVRPIDAFRVVSHRRPGLGLPPPAPRSRASLCSGGRTSLLRFHANPLSVRRPNPSSLRRRLKLTISAVFERFTERAIKAVIFSQREAKALGKEMVFPQHLLLGLISEDRSRDGFLGSGITIESAREAVKRIWSDEAAHSSAVAGSSGSATDLPFAVSSKRAFDAAVEFSRTMACNFISTEHIAIGLFTVDDGSAGKVIKSLGADINQLKSLALLRLQGELAKDGRDPSMASPKTREKNYISGKSALMRSSVKSKDKGLLAQFCIDLTARASEGLIDPVIGRQLEVQRVVQILCRRTKNNPILLGEPGVGKTAIAEGLALCISNGEIPIFLMAKRIMALDVGLLMAGAKERGELEARVTGLISEVQKAGDVILFIDEVHTLIGSGTVGRSNKGSGLDISNLLKPALGRGELQCIASTTLDEHRAHFEKDKALARRFQPVLINEPSQEDAGSILMGLREKYESHHRCKFTFEAVNAAVYLSARYIPDRHLPDKAIDLIDEAGSRARINAFKRKKEAQTSILSKTPDEYWQEIRAVQTMHEVVLANKIKYSSIQSGSDANDVVGNAKTTILESFAASVSDEEPVTVGPEDIAAVASLWSGIPVQELTADEMKRLVDLEEVLKKRVIGQDDAVIAISRAIKRSRVGFKDPDRPIAAMLFCGPTGVGKTELTKALAESYYGSESVMLRLDMSEYMERFTVSKLIGSPPGYVGYGEGGTLTEAVRRKPFTLILMDEIEKAHPDIFNILLQIFEDGHLTDSQGRRVSFKNTLIVMTSNVGSSSICKGRRSIGFMLEDDSESNSYAAMKSLVMEELKAYFRPELLNRIDDVVVFHSLKKEQMVELENLLSPRAEGLCYRIAILVSCVEVVLAVKCHNICEVVAEMVFKLERTALYRGEGECCQVEDEGETIKMMEILNIMLEEVKGRLLSLGMGLHVSDLVKDLVCQQGYDKSFGARPLRRAVTQFIEDVISEALLAGDYRPGDTLLIDTDASGNPSVSCLTEQDVQMLSDAKSMLSANAAKKIKLISQEYEKMTLNYQLKDI